MPPNRFFWGWVFSTFARQPLQYAASFGEAMLTGKLYVHYYSPTSAYTGSCAVALTRSQKLDYQANPDVPS